MLLTAEEQCEPFYPVSITFGSVWVFGLSLPLLLIVLTLSVTLYQLTGFANDVAITPLYQRGEQTLARVDQLLVTLDQRLSDDDPGLLAPLKQIELLPELKLLASQCCQVTG